MLKKTFSLVSSTLLAATLLNADTVVTNDGAQLTGTITLIDSGVIHLDTAYAGKLEIDQSKVASFSTDAPVFVRLASGSTMAGPVMSAESGKLKIESEDGTLETSMDRVVASWGPDAEDPEVVALRESKKAMERNWKYRGGIDILGKSGNTEQFDVGFRFDAKLQSPNDELAFYAEYENRESDGNTTADRTEVGTSYEAFFSEHYGWYVRTTAEKDDIDNIDFRSTTGAGASFRIINKDYQTLVARSGLGYRYTTYSNATPNESSPTLDFGLKHSYTYKDIFRMENSLTYAPSIDDFATYVVIHDTGLEFPVGSGDSWKLRVGIKNEFDSQPAAQEKLDTTYYSRMIYSWD